MSPTKEIWILEARPAALEAESRATWLEGA